MRNLSFKKALHSLSIGPLSEMQIPGTLERCISSIPLTQYGKTIIG